MMLNSIRQHTQDPAERQLLADALDKLEESLSKQSLSVLKLKLTAAEQKRDKQLKLLGLLTIKDFFGD